MDIGNTHQKFGKDPVCDSRDIPADRQTNRHTPRQRESQIDALITILRNHCYGRSNHDYYYHN